jgi:hypothetical protein
MIQGMPQLSDLSVIEGEMTAFAEVPTARRRCKLSLNTVGFPYTFQGQPQAVQSMSEFSSVCKSLFIKCLQFIQPALQTVWHTGC